MTTLNSTTANTPFVTKRPSARSGLAHEPRRTDRPTRRRTVTGTLDRIRNLYSLVLRADAVLVGGQMSQPFLAAIGRQPPHDELPEFLDECRHAYGVGNMIRHLIDLPSDLVWGRSDGSLTTAEQLEAIEGSIGDIGPRTGVAFADVLRGARSILWAGSLGEVEDVRFAEGTLAVGRALLNSRARIVIGGDALLQILGKHWLLH